MSQMPVEVEMGGKFEPPTNTQFNVFLDNRVGRMLRLVEIFADQPLTLAGFSILEATGHAVVRVLTSNAALARRLLNRHEYPFSEQQILCIELDEQHTIATVCQTLVTAEVSISYAYALLIRPRKRPVIALHCDDCHFAAQILRKKLFVLLGENDLGDNRTGSAPDAAI